MKIGDKIVGVWGARFPEWEGKISKINPTNQGTEVDVRWENGSTTHAMEWDIRNKPKDDYAYPIGLYLVEGI
jgi:PDZ domain-containing secreted protein